MELVKAGGLQDDLTRGWKDVIRRGGFTWREKSATRDPALRVGPSAYPSQSSLVLIKLLI